MLPTLLLATRLHAQGESADPLSGVPDYLSLWEILKSGGFMMFPLAVLSVIGVFLIFLYFFSIRRGAVVTRRYMDEATGQLQRGDLLGMLALSNRHNEAVAHVMRRTLDFALQHTAEHRLVREVAETEAARQASLLGQRISYLADVGAIAPMVGLLGTVIGMIQSFTVLAEDVAASRPMLLAEGVSVALVTTATGLVIGIPALAFYAYFRGRVQKLVADLEAATTQLLALLALHYDKKKSRPGEDALERAAAL